MSTSRGSDIFSRVLYGARVSLTVAIVGTGIAMLIGTTLGIIAGYYRGIVDTIISRTVDVFLAFPILLLALGVGSACSLGNGCAGGLIEPGMTTVIGIIVLISWTYFARLARGQVLSLREKEFVEAARATGASDLAILGREILPNLVTPVLVYMTLVIPLNILLEAALSFLGVGHQSTSGELGTDDRARPRHCSTRRGGTSSSRARPRPHRARVQPARRGGPRRPRPSPVPHEVKGEEMDARITGSRSSLSAAIAGSALLVASTGSGATGAKRGGTLKLISSGDVDSVDPGQTYYSFGWQVLTAVHRTLYAIPANSSRPSPTSRRRCRRSRRTARTITVRIKRGVRFGPPVNREVTSADVKYAIERSFSVSVTNGYVNLYFSDIVGAPASPPKTPKPVSGIKTPNKYTIVFKLKRPGTTLGERARDDEHRSHPEGVRREVRQQDDVGLRLLPGGHRAVHVRGGRADGQHQGRGLHAGPLDEARAQSELVSQRRTSGPRTWTRSRSRRGSPTPRSASARSSTAPPTAPATTGSSRSKP